MLSPATREAVIRPDPMRREFRSDLLNPALDERAHFLSDFWEGERARVVVEVNDGVEGSLKKIKASSGSRSAPQQFRPRLCDACAGDDEDVGCGRGLSGHATSACQLAGFFPDFVCERNAGGM